MSLLLELNDAALTLYRDGEALYRQPAIALLQPKAVSFGTEALRQARAHPQSVNQNYLSRLNADPVPKPNRLITNHADLMYRQLLALKPLIDAPLAVAAPGYLSPERLGVLLGIATEAGLTIRGFIDTALLLASGAGIPGPVWVLDLHVSRCCLTELKSNGVLARGLVADLTGAGLSACIDKWANLAADRLVEESRFDPLLSGATEQQLYDQLYAWLETGEPDLALAIHQDATVRRIRLAADDLAQALRECLAPIRERIPMDARLAASAGALRLPGLADTLTDLGFELTQLPEDALTSGFAAQDARIEGQRLLTEAPRPQSAGATPAPPLARHEPAPDRTSTATHVLIGHRAWPLIGNAFGAPEAGAVGELVAADGKRFQLIRVEPDAG